MKVLPFKILKPEKDAFIFQIDKKDAFYDKLHQHKEIQLSYILEGEGTLIVGDTINYYATGDILVIGSNIPHVLKSDVKTAETSSMITLFFTEEAFGENFFELEELKELQKFFIQSKQGFKITSKQKRIKALFLELEKASKLHRFIILIQLLEIIAKANYKSLSSFIYDKKYSDIEGYRMRNIFEYTMNNFDKNIDLKEISDKANMTPNAFCRYFKQRTNKTYFTFLNELRLEKAAKLLITNTDLPISNIAHQCGFKNLANFNRKFKEIKHTTPSKYRKN